MKAPIDTLAEKWRMHKAIEDKAREDRILVEQEILKLNPAPEEGSTTVHTPTGVKISLTGKISYKANMDQLLELTKGWPEAARPIKTKIEVDETKMKVLRRDTPRLWAEIASAIETKPAKTGVSIDFKE